MTNLTLDVHHIHSMVVEHKHLPAITGQR
jgi:hypothetical protein